MKQFVDLLDDKLVDFYPYINIKVEMSRHLFKHSQGTLSDFIVELKETAQMLANQKGGEYAQLYAQRLILQFDALQAALVQLKKPKVQSFQSSYRFARNIHQLPIERRLLEYKKALRALNEKLGWLTEQSYLCQNDAQKQDYIAQIQETEYRRQKCLKAIEEIE